jgi:L-rhamnose mutarotase
MDCGHCPRRKECKSICPEVEKVLRKREVAGYSLAHRKRKEVIYNAQKIEDLAARVAFTKLYGKKYPLSIDQEE